VVAAQRAFFASVIYEGKMNTINNMIEQVEKEGKE